MIGKKLVYFGPGDVRIEEIKSIPIPSEGELLVRIDATAVCGSDIKSYRIGNPKMHIPITMGHEFSGTIIDPVLTEGFQAGERITMATTIGCGVCFYCVHGKPNLCAEAKAMGFYYNGALANYMIIPSNAVERGNVVKITDDIPPEIAALSEPMSCVLNGLSRIPMNEIENAVIIGIGAMGMLHGIALKEYGVKNILFCGSEGFKKNVVSNLGFNTISHNELEQAYLDYSDNRGFDLVIITAPSNQIQAEAPKYARKGGFVSYFAGLPTKDEWITISSRTLHYNELIFYGTSDSTATHVSEAVGLLSKQRDNVRKIITILPFSEILEGIQSVIDREGAKVVVLPFNDK